MQVSYKAVYHLIDKFYTRRSLNGIIEDCGGDFEEALQTALDIEDYRFLSVMKTKRDIFENKYVLFYNFKNQLLTILYKDKPLSLVEFAILCVDCGDIPDIEFKEVVHSQATEISGVDENETRAEFDAYISKVRKSYSPDKKIRRNDPCYCASGKKYKDCHGSLVEE